MAQRNLHQPGPESTGKAGFEALLNAGTLAAQREPGSSDSWGAARREEWLSYLNILYSQVLAALQPYLESKQVSIEYRDMTLVEEYLGEYTVRKMLVKLGSTEIVLEPVGTMVLAAKGRLDVIGPFGKTPLLLVDSKARHLSDVSQWSVTDGSGVVASSHKPPTSITWEWRVVSKSLDRKLISLNEEVILGLFAEVANG